MNTINNIGFITSKINQLQTAAFHSHSKNVLQLNPTIISTLKVDENGYIWFLLNKPVQKVTEFEKQFPVALNYYKKGEPFFLNVFGIARIVNDPEELACVEAENDIKELPYILSGEKLLLSVRISNVNYYEKEPYTNKSWFTKLKKVLSSVFLQDDDFYYSYESDKHFA